jgi:hypothetical protein
MMDEQESISNSYLFEFWLDNYEINNLFQVPQSDDGSL